MIHLNYLGELCYEKEKRICCFLRGNKALAELKQEDVIVLAGSALVTV